MMPYVNICLTFDRVYHWQLLLEEITPEIVYIKWIHNLAADAISWLDYNPEVNPTSKFSYSTIGVPTKEGNCNKIEDLLKALVQL